MTIRPACRVGSTPPNPIVEAATEFYRGLFGWDLEDRMPAEAPGRYCVARLQGRDVATVASQPEGATAGPVWSTYIRVDDADDSGGRVDEAGGTVLAEPFDVVQAGRMAACADPSGAEFKVWQAGTHRGARWSTSRGRGTGATSTPATSRGPRRSTGRCSAGRPTPSTSGFGEGNMMPVPGTREFLEQIDPACAAVTPKARAPAKISPRRSAGRSTSPRRVPTDAPPLSSLRSPSTTPTPIAERARKLGGEVLTPPFDAGPG